jgi:hypothetical protein
MRRIRCGAVARASQPSLWAGARSGRPRAPLRAPFATHTRGLTARFPFDRLLIFGMNIRRLVDGAQLGYVQEDDGTFFMEFREYAAAMNTVYICKVRRSSRAAAMA